MTWKAQQVDASTATPDEPTPTAGGARSPRDRILDAAAELFSAQGIHLVSADKIIDRARVAKATFYRHFSTKDDLVVAYLEREGAREREALDEIRRSANDDAEALRLFAQRIEAESRRPGSRGCPFINAGAEYADPDSPVRKVVAGQRTWFRETLAQLLAQLGVTDPERAADELAALRDGAMVAGRLDGPDRARRALTESFFAVVDARAQGSACRPL
jgi:AcrR family transcriptional regulator